MPLQFTCSHAAQFCSSQSSFSLDSSIDAPPCSALQQRLKCVCCFLTLPAVTGPPTFTICKLTTRRVCLQKPCSQWRQRRQLAAGGTVNRRRHGRACAAVAAPGTGGLPGSTAGHSGAGLAAAAAGLQRGGPPASAGAHGAAGADVARRVASAALLRAPTCGVVRMGAPTASINKDTTVHRLYSCRCVLSLVT